MFMFHHIQNHNPGTILVLALAVYVYLAVCLQVLAKKTGTEQGWMGWVPILNLYLFCKLGGKPGWWVLLFFVPFVNVFFGVIIFMAIAEARGKPYWWGILIVVPLVRALVPGYLAFSGPKSPAYSQAGAGG